MCRRARPRRDFARNRSSRDGLRGYCRRHARPDNEQRSYIHVEAPPGTCIVCRDQDAVPGCRLCQSCAAVALQRRKQGYELATVQIGRDVPVSFRGGDLPEFDP